MNISNSNAPITVLMPVYNAERYVGEAIESILNQTFRDFKILIIDDGSTGRSCEIIRAYSLEDHRIELVINESNMGITKTLNKGLSMIDTPYIARMDSDDISLPHRFEKQLDIMENNSDLMLF
jgi:glycosyltransferase involved in cell wall biosynthesis